MASRLAKTTAAGLVATGLGAGAIEKTGAWEGLLLYAYKDIVGVWTACYGETAGIREGMVFTQEKCDSMFLASLAKHEAGMRACLDAPDRIPDNVYVATVDLTYNVGVGAFCRSTMRRHLNAGRWVDACREHLKWVRAGGRVVKGLVNRRTDIMRYCLADTETVSLPARGPDA